MRKILALAITALTLNASAAEPKKSAYHVAPVFGNVVGFSVPFNFVAKHEDVNSKQHIREAIPEGETLEKWSQMITITGGKDIPKEVTPEHMVASIASSFHDACPKTFKHAAKDKGMISGYPSYMAILSCGSDDKNKTSETAAVIAIKADDVLYTVQWAERIDNEPNPLQRKDAGEVWKKRISSLAPVFVCKPKDGEKAPYKSCLDKLKSK